MKDDDDKEETIFVPLITDSLAGDDKKSQRRELAQKFEQALHIRECARAAAKFKSNGSVCGHKVLDNAAAVDAVIEAAPVELGEAISRSPLSQYEKTQVLDHELRKWFEMNKAGKLTGNKSARLLKLEAKRSAKDAPETPQPSP